ncbi:hypothetical protein P7C71_g4249, partial [Lecanoromycetidae sp. Uapishka_2]
MRSLLPLLILTSSHFPLPTNAAQSCNNHPELCPRQYSNISQIGTHDSPFIGLLPQDNQDLSLPSQLNAGIRFLQAQTHADPFGTLNLCHTSCFEEDAGSLETYLTTIKSWLDTNPNEVLTLLLVNGDNLDIDIFDAAFTSSGIKPYAYIPPTTPLAISAWPTLGEMITAATRLVIFLDAGAKPSVPYILDEFTYFFETPYDTTDPTFPECKIDRPPGASPEGRMYIVNHFLDVDVFGIDMPDDAADGATNAKTGRGSISAQVELCVGLYGRAPVGVLVDYFERGDVFGAQNALNGLG